MEHEVDSGLYNYISHIYLYIIYIIYIYIELKIPIRAIRVLKFYQGPMFWGYVSTFGRSTYTWSCFNGMAHPQKKRSRYWEKETSS